MELPPWVIGIIDRQKQQIRAMQRKVRRQRDANRVAEAKHARTVEYLQVAHAAALNHLSRATSALERSESLRNALSIDLLAGQSFAYGGIGGVWLAKKEKVEGVFAWFVLELGSETRVKCDSGETARRTALRNAMGE